MSVCVIVLSEGVQSSTIVERVGLVYVGVVGAAMLGYVSASRLGSSE